MERTVMERSLRNLEKSRCAAININDVRKSLLANSSSLYWPWLSDLKGRRATKKSANKFMLGCILDYQMPADLVWENAKQIR